MERLKCLLVHDYEVGRGGGGVSILNYDFAEFLTNQALSQNLVPIARKTYGPKEVLNNEIFFFDGNENELYEKIKDVLRNYDEYKNIIFEIKKEVLTKFDYKRNFSLMEDVILESILFKKERIPIFEIESSPVFV
jgi:hypothetical protein